MEEGSWRDDTALLRTPALTPGRSVSIPSLLIVNDHGQETKSKASLIRFSFAYQRE